MKYNNVFKGEFISRPNRFIAKVVINGNEHTVHVKNTGRCKELLIKGATVYLEKSQNPARKTAYDLIAAQKKTKGGNILINMDSQIPNVVAAEWLKNSNLFPKSTTFKREVFYKNSRFDIYAENENTKAFIEVKGVTLEKDGVAMFPDAPTLRGVKHINELIYAKQNGFDAYIIFIIQMKGVKYFTPNYETHKEFGDILKKAASKGVKIICLDCITTPDSISADNFVEISL